MYDTWSYFGENGLGLKELSWCENIIVMYMGMMWYDVVWYGSSSGSSSVFGRGDDACFFLLFSWAAVPDFIRCIEIWYRYHILWCVWYHNLY